MTDHKRIPDSPGAELAAGGNDTPADSDQRQAAPLDQVFDALDFSERDRLDLDDIITRNGTDAVVDVCHAYLREAGAFVIPEDAVPVMLEALRRLASPEGFEAIGVIPENKWGDELRARMAFAEAAIAKAEANHHG